MTNKVPKFSVAIFLLVASASLLYYFFYFLPNKERSKDLQSKEQEYRKECAQEIDDKFTAVDNLVQSIKNITKEEAQNIARRAGVTDENNYVIDKDVLIKECISKKQGSSN